MAVHARLADEVVDEGDVIDDVAEGSDDLAEPFARLAIGLEFPRTRETRARRRLKELHRFAGVPGFAVLLLEERLVVEGVDMARRPRHEELHDPFRAWRMMQRAGKDSVAREEIGKGEARERARERAEEGAA